jgi:branched-chain amino acid transport system substrate-binding protein
MKQQLRLAGLAVALIVAAHAAAAQEKIKIGVIVTLSGPAAVLGQQARDGFALAVRDLGGKMAGRDVELVVVDDELKPDAAVTKVKGLLERDKVDFVVGPIFSNILQAIHKPVVDSKTFLISPNAGPSSYAGKNCSPFFYVTSLSERSGPRDPRQGRPGPRLQARLYSGAELSGRQGFRRRVQARLQG